MCQRVRAEAFHAAGDTHAYPARVLDVELTSSMALIEKTLFLVIPRLKHHLLFQSLPALLGGRQGV
jgi:hypothetical protein